MSFLVPISSLNKQQLYDISQKLYATQSRGRGMEVTHHLYQRLNIVKDGEEIPYVLLPMAVMARLSPDGIQDVPVDHYNRKPNDAMVYDKISGSILSSFSLRDKQTGIIDDAMKKLRKYSTCLLNLSCAFGKTCMSIYLGQKTRYKWLFITPRKVLKKQTLKDACKVTQETVQIVTSKCSIDPSASGYIISSHIMKNYHYEDFASVGTVILDEIHMLLTPGFLPNLFNLCPRYLIALSATPDRKDGMDSALPFFIDSRSNIQAIVVQPIDLIKADTALKLKIKFTKTGEVDWTAMLQQQADCDWRNLAIATLASHYLSYRPLILCGRKDQVRSIYSHLTNMGVPTDTFMENDEDFDPNAQVLVAIMNKIGVGFDGDFNCCIFASDVTDIRQMVGRVGRHLDSDDDKPVVIDLVDRFSTMNKHFLKDRLPQYKEFCAVDQFRAIEILPNAIIEK